MNELSCLKQQIKKYCCNVTVLDDFDRAIIELNKPKMNY
jgi:hypothetical protein